MNPISFCRSVLILILTPLFILVISVVTIILMVVFRQRPARVQWLPRYMFRLIIGLSGVKVDVFGMEKFAAPGPYIFAANHQSQFDIFALQAYLNCDFRWLAKKELFNVPIFGTAMRLAGYIQVDRAHGRQALHSLNKAAARIAAGTSVIIFPEGTRSRDGKLKAFKSGIINLAIKSGVPLVPLGISGTYEILPKGRILARPGRIIIRVGEPIATSGYTAKERNNLAKRLEDAVADLLDVDG